MNFKGYWKQESMRGREACMVREQATQVGHETILDDDRTLMRFTQVHTYNDFVPAHWHSHLEILFILSGEITACINEAVYKLHAGDLLIVNPGDIHYTHVQEECRYYLLQIPKIHLARICADWQLLHFQEFIPCSGDIESLSRKLQRVFEELDRLNREKEKGHHLLILIQLYELLYLLYTKDSVFLSASNRNRTERDFGRIEQSMSYVRAHYSEQITLAEVAAQLAVSPEYFCRLFKKYAGQTFFEYVNQVRLSHFYQDLLQTDESITYLMDKNGITSYKTFLKNFKAIYGTTPYKLREREKDFTFP